MGIYHFLIVIMGSTDAPSVGIYRRISKTVGGGGRGKEKKKNHQRLAGDSSGTQAITSPC